MAEYLKIFFFALIGLLALCGCNPFKVTDPNDPRFDIKKFELNDYRSNKEIAEVIRKYMPIGTSRNDVEKILVSIAGASITDFTNQRNYKTGTAADIEVLDLKNSAQSIFRYGHKGRNATFYWQIYIFYDHEDRLMQVVTGNVVVF